MGNPVVHWELMSKDPGKVADFYARIFGETGGDGGINGGIVKPAQEGPWPGFTDPEGRMMGLWKSKTK